MSRAIWFLLRLSVGVAACAATAFAHAQVPGTYKCVDGTGRNTYTNVKEAINLKNCTLVSREVSVVPSPAPLPAAKAAPSSASAAARVDAPTQRSRDADRRRILEDELQTADRQLTDARQRLEQETQRGGTPPGRLKSFQDNVKISEDNVSALRRELANLR